MLKMVKYVVWFGTVLYVGDISYGIIGEICTASEVQVWEQLFNVDDNGGSDMLWRSRLDLVHNKLVLWRATGTDQANVCLLAQQFGQLKQNQRVPLFLFVLWRCCLITQLYCYKSIGFSNKLSPCYHRKLVVLPGRGNHPQT